MEIGGATKLKNEGPRDPNLAFNNFQALKSDFGSDIRFCQPTRFPSLQSHSSKRKNEMIDAECIRSGRQKSRASGHGNRALIVESPQFLRTSAPSP
jgi:hypothetical protein